ncbi:MAG: hypothetical protein M3Y56_10280, partial [Armatimonadota bacterium]|nr:hypothetical protein [Armatimonadota bacterium]
DRTVAIVCDSIAGVWDIRSEDVVQPDTILPAMNCVEGVVRRDDGMIILYRLEELLAAEPITELPEPVP